MLGANDTAFQHAFQNFEPPKVTYPAVWCPRLVWVKMYSVWKLHWPCGCPVQLAMPSLPPLLPVVPSGLPAGGVSCAWLAAHTPSYGVMWASAPCIPLFSSSSSLHIYLCLGKVEQRSSAAISGTWAFSLLSQYA
jgi:hypothetical protein